MRDTITVRACETDTPQAKVSHTHLYDDDTGKFSICTATYEYQQVAAQAIYEAEHGL